VCPRLFLSLECFRSSFRDWAGNKTGYPRELIETALAHVIGDKAEQAYRRSDALEKRRQLMEAWVSYCTADPTQKGRANQGQGVGVFASAPPVDLRSAPSSIVRL
jgi:hypothetical protein